MLCSRLGDDLAPTPGFGECARHRGPRVGLADPGPSHTSSAKSCAVTCTNVAAAATHRARRARRPERAKPLWASRIPLNRCGGVCLRASTHSNRAGGDKSRTRSSLRWPETPIASSATSCSRSGSAAPLAVKEQSSPCCCGKHSALIETRLSRNRSVDSADRRPALRDVHSTAGRHRGPLHRSATPRYMGRYELTAAIPAKDDQIIEFPAINAERVLSVDDTILKGLESLPRMAAFGEAFHSLPSFILKPGQDHGGIRTSFDTKIADPSRGCSGAELTGLASLERRSRLTVGVAPTVTYRDISCGLRSPSLPKSGSGCQSVATKARNHAPSLRHDEDRSARLHASRPTLNRESQVIRQARGNNSIAPNRTEAGPS